MSDIKAELSQKKKLILSIVVVYLFVSILVYNGAVEIVHISKWREYISFTSIVFHSSHVSLPDVHLEDPILGHAGEVYGHDHETVKQGTTIAVGLGITAKGVHHANESNIAEKFQFFHTFLPTFCNTSSPGYTYLLYLAYDYNDNTLTKPSILNAFHDAFKKIVAEKCPKNLRTSIHFVQCDHGSRPAWAQNDAMLEAYLDNADYYYRINDDSFLYTKYWTEAFIETLSGYSPKNVGVVGPYHHGGNMDILTYDFVHRTHVDILGYYYPRTITDWWADDWITGTYAPERMTKLTNVTLIHTLGMGQRYGANLAVEFIWKGQMAKDQARIQRYLKHLNTTALISNTNSRNIISMSLFGRDPKYTWGAIRNAQIAPIFYPGWKLRFYILDPQVSKTYENSSLSVPPRILRKLQQLGAELVSVSHSMAETIPGRLWRYLIIEDTKVDYFLVRDTTSRFSDRESLVVNSWINAKEQQSSDPPVLHCIRDHPSHSNRSVVEGLWDGDARKIRDRLPSQSVTSVIQAYLKESPKSGNETVIDSVNSTQPFGEYLWSRLNLPYLCHDSVSCAKWPHSVPINLERKDLEYIGQKYDEHQEIIPVPAWNPEIRCGDIRTDTTTAIFTTTERSTTTVTTVTSAASASTTAAKNSTG